MRVLISLTGIEWARFFSALAPRIWSPGDLEVYGFAHTRRWVDEARALGLPQERILYISENRRDLLRQPVDYGYLKRMEDRYGLPFLWPFVIAEKTLWGKRYDAVAKTLEIEFRLVTEFLARVRPDVILTEAIGGISTYIMWSWAQRHGARVVLPFTARLPHRFVVLDNPYDRWTSMERRFEEIRRHGLTSGEREAAGRLRDELIEKEIQPSYVTLAISQFNPPRPVKDARRGVRYIRSYLRHRGWRDYTTRSPWAYAADQTMKQVRVLAHRMLPVYEAPKPGEPYVLYPLQIWPEASVMVWAPFFTDQVALVEAIARSLPVGYRLYAKEHIAAWHDRPLTFYRTLRRIPNVRIIHPHVPAHALVRGAAAVATITSTMGWEALLHRKPVVTFGNVFYNACPLVRHVTALDQLPHVMRELLTGYTPDEDVLPAFIAAILDRTYPGEIDAYMPEFLAPDNIAEVAAGIRAELALTGPQETRGELPGRAKP